MAPASYAALPQLAQIAMMRRDVVVEPAMSLFTAIIPSDDGPSPWNDSTSPVSDK